MKKVILAFVVIISAIKIHAQISGISASKLATFNTSTVPNKGIEFEPSTAFGLQKKAWDADGKTYDLFQSTDSASYSSELNFRFSYGVAERLEIGMSVPQNVEQIALGTKFRFLEKEKTSSALLFGVNIPFGNDFRTLKNNHSEDALSLAGGLALSQKFTDNLSMDANAQFQMFPLEVTDKHSDMFVNADLGYYFPAHVQVIGGLYYKKSFSDIKEHNSETFSLQLGTTIERSEKFILVMYFSQDFMGKNADKTSGFGLALTLPIL